MILTYIQRVVHTKKISRKTMKLLDRLVDDTKARCLFGTQHMKHVHSILQVNSAS
jgi:hypothetical protein